MRFTNHYVFSSYLRNLYVGYSLRLHKKHSAGAWKP